MNGVRRLLGTATSSSSSSSQAAVIDQPVSALTIPAKSLNGPSWPPPSPSVATTPTPVLPLKKETPSRFQPTPPPDGATSRISDLDLNFRRSTDSPSPSTSPRPPPSKPTLTLRKLIARTQSPSDKRSSGTSSTSEVTTRDQLLLDLMASQAVVDSRNFEILTSEEVDELSKEYQVLASRLEAMNKKLTLETRMRDAAISLSKVNASQRRPSKQTDEQLEAANRRVETTQRELWRASERTSEVQRRVLEHRAGVLSYSVRSMEKKMGANSGTGDDSGYDSSNRSTLIQSPTTSSMTGVSTSTKTRFDGLHLYAGHAGTVMPRRQLSTEAATAEITALEEKLKAATMSLTAAGRKQVEMTRELSMMRLEKQEVEALMGIDLQSAEETIAHLEEESLKLGDLDVEVKRLREEKEAWAKERVRLEMKAQDAGVNRGPVMTGPELAESRKLVQEKEDEIRRITAQWYAERAVWERQRTEGEDQKLEDLSRLQQEMDTTREEDEQALQKAHEELDAGVDAIRSLVQKHGIVLFSRDSSLQGLLTSVGTHLEAVHSKMDAHTRSEDEWNNVRRKLEEDVRTGLDKRETLARDLEEARRERDEARTLAAKEPPPVQPPSPTVLAGEVGRITQILMPIWSVLPSPEARANKFNSRQYRTGSPTTPQMGSSAKVVSSLSELDVRSLKSLYDATRLPMSPVVGGGEFSIEAFASRVQALIQDDRALIERLLRFAQAHDLLKKNAERAQKLAQEGNLALETYQKQVRTLEERNMSMASKQAALMEEVQQLQSTMERIEGEKRQIETLAAEQAETCRELTEANNTLSARTLTLAEEAASAPEMIRKQLEGQLTEMRTALEASQDEVDAMRTSEQSQRIALLDELNTMQRENGQLRAQLRARK